MAARRLTRRAFLATAAAGAATGPFVFTPAKAQSFNWKRFQGKELFLMLTKHPFIDVLEKNIPEFESLSGMKVKWETLPEIVRLSAGALHHMAETVAGLEIDPGRMRQNLELTHGLIFAEAVSAVLARKTGKMKAHQILETASRTAIEEKKHLRDVLMGDSQVSPHLSKSEIEKLFEPLNYTGVAGQFIDRAIAASKTDSGKSD